MSVLVAAACDLVFDERGGRPLAIDIFVPQNVVAPPLIIFVHGGGWISGDKTMYADEVGYWLEQGYACVLASYRLAPLSTFPAQIEDLQDLVMYLRENHEKYGYDPKRFVAFGNSAGGHLAAMLGSCDTYFGTQHLTAAYKVEAVVSICGLLDLREPRTNHNAIGWSFLEQFLGTLDDEPKNIQASPLAQVSPGDAAMLIIHGELDDIVPVSQAHAMATALKSAGLDHELVILPGEFHSFSFEGWSTIRQRALAFIQRIVGKPEPKESERSMR